VTMKYPAASGRVSRGFVRSTSQGAANQPLQGIEYAKLMQGKKIVLYRSFSKPGILTQQLTRSCSSFNEKRLKSRSDPVFIR